MVLLATVMCAGASWIADHAKGGGRDPLRQCFAEMESQYDEKILSTQTAG